MRDITDNVVKNRLLYVWDSMYQTIENDGWYCESNFRKFKQECSELLESYADILDSSPLTYPEIRKIEKKYREVRYLTQLGHLYSTNDPKIKRGYYDLYFSEVARVLKDRRMNVPLEVIDVKFPENGGIDISRLSLVGSLRSKTKSNLYDVISERLGFDAWKENHPLMSMTEMKPLNTGWKLHIYADVNDPIHAMRDTLIIKDFYEKVPELDVSIYFLETGVRPKDRFKK